jgi:hypothetical protein
MTCTACRDHLLHCHEASVEHQDGVSMCLDPGCDVPHLLHVHQLSCTELDGACPCADVEQTLLLAA